MNAVTVKNVFEKNGIILDEVKYEKFALYCDFLLEYNEKVNLTAIRDENEVLIYHFVDSILGNDLIKKDAKCADIGTGAGFPGVPLAIVRDDISVTLIDSLQKRIDFLNTLCEKLELKNITTIHGRSEDLAHDPKLRQSFDCVFSRAVARLNILAEYDLPFVKNGGCMLAWKGPQGEEEIAEAKNALAVLNACVSQVKRTELENHIIIEIRENGKIASKYPRQAGTPKKKPL